MLQFKQFIALTLLLSNVTATLIDTSNSVLTRGSYRGSRLQIINSAVRRKRSSEISGNENIASKFDSHNKLTTQEDPYHDEALHMTDESLYDYYYDDNEDAASGFQLFNMHALQVTNASSAINITAVNMCCNETMQVFNQNMMLCESATQTVTPPLFHDEDGNLVDNLSYETVHGIPNCSVYALSPSTSGPSDNFVVTATGELMVGVKDGKFDSNWFKVERNRYCLLYPEPDVLEALVCFPDDIDEPESSVYRHRIQRHVFPVCLIISSVFLLLTLVVHCLVKELREDLLSKGFMCSIAMLALAQILLVTREWNTDIAFYSHVCSLLGAITQFSFLSAFLWLNVISWTVLRSLWSHKPSACNSRRVFAWHCLYAFGVAFALSLLATLIDTLPVLSGSFLPTPKFAGPSCWFSNRPALIAYFFGPITLLLFTNIVCFCLSAYKIVSLQKRSDRTAMHFSQYLKLFVLMGVSWVFEVISFFISTAYTHHVINDIWIFFDLVNILQGVLIFVLFVCRPTVLRHLFTKLFGAACVRRCRFLTPADEGDKDETQVAPCNTVV